MDLYKLLEELSDILCTALISVIKVGKLCPKPKTNHESPKRRKHEKRIR
ncbi:MAG: hypothetical protein JRD71_03955 [Deltaproteobacteria bacterium]|nr:hypothetical protein [Deltaproteobacteria bacterium]